MLRALFDFLPSHAIMELFEKDNFLFFKFIWYFKPLKTDLFISFYVFFMIIYRQSESLKVNICSQITCQFA